MGWMATTANEFHETFVTFGHWLSEAPVPHFIHEGSAAPPECPGVTAHPTALPGHLCMYEESSGNVHAQFPCSLIACPFATRYGVGFRARSVAAGNAWTRGTWAVTAP